MSAQDRGWGSPPVPRESIVTVRTDMSGTLLPVHQVIAPLVKALCDLTEAGPHGNYRLRPDWCWGYAPRLVRGSSTVWSNHAWGLAVDLNAPVNPMASTLITNMPRWLPEMWKAYGFAWGGDYVSRKDAMHFEFMGTPADARRFIAHLGATLPTVPTVPTGERMMYVCKQDDKGPAVKLAQKRINRLAAEPNRIAADGDYGPATAALVAAVTGLDGAAVKPEHVDRIEHRIMLKVARQAVAGVNETTLTPQQVRREATAAARAAVTAALKDEYAVTIQRRAL